MFLKTYFSTIMHFAFELAMCRTNINPPPLCFVLDGSRGKRLNFNEVTVDENDELGELGAQPNGSPPFPLPGKCVRGPPGVPFI